MRRVFYDCEFLENGRTIDLISIGMVDEEGNEFYGIDYEAPWDRVSNHNWLMNNVMPHLPSVISLATPQVMRRDSLRRAVFSFLRPTSDYEDMELWANNGAYDHVCLAQLLGPRLTDMPQGVPWYTNDLQQLWRAVGRPEKPPKPTDQHNALSDARWNRDWWTVCRIAMDDADDKEEQL
jgi:3' exoribonuclease, RNase T-like